MHELAKKEAEERINQSSHQTANTMTGSTVTTNNTNTSGGNTPQNCSQFNVLSVEERTLDKAMKPDMDSFKTLKSDVEFSTWFPIFRAEANKQGFGNLLDSTYTPPAGQEVLYKVFYSFLVKHLMTNKGQDICTSFRRL